MIILNNFSEHLFKPVKIMQTVPEQFPKIPAGFCVIDTSIPKVLNNVSDTFRLVTNKSLVEMLRDVGNPTIKTAYKNLNEDSFHIVGTFPNMMKVGEINFLQGWEISNSYSGRFAPSASWLIVSPYDNSFIRTGLPLLSGSRKQIAEDEYDIHPFPDDLSALVKTLTKEKFNRLTLSSAQRLPQAYRNQFMSDCNVCSGDMKVYQSLRLMSVALLDWAKNNYEGHKHFTEVLFRKTIKLVEEI
jgi:hypothetical protein